MTLRYHLGIIFVVLHTLWPAIVIRLTLVTFVVVPFVDVPSRHQAVFPSIMVVGFARHRVPRGEEYVRLRRRREAGAGEGATAARGARRDLLLGRVYYTPLWRAHHGGADGQPAAACRSPWLGAARRRGAAGDGVGWREEGRGHAAALCDGAQWGGEGAPAHVGTGHQRRVSPSWARARACLLRWQLVLLLL